MVKSIFNPQPTSGPSSVFNSVETVSSLRATTPSRLALMAGLGGGNNYAEIQSKTERAHNTPEDELRREAGLDVIARRVRGFSQFLDEVDLNEEQEAAAAGVEMARAVAQQDPDTAGRTALEERYIDTIETVAESYPDYVPPPLMSVADVDFRDRRWNTSVNMEIIDSLIAPIQAERDRRNPIHGVGEMLTFGIPMLWSTAQSGHVGDESATIFDNFLAGFRQRGEAAEFWQRAQTMSPEEFGEYAYNLNESFRNAATLGGLHNQVLHQQLWEELLDSLPAELTNTINFIDNVPLVGMVGQAGRMITRGPIRAMRAAGSRQAAAQTAAVEIVNRQATGRSAVSVDDLVDAVSPSAISTNPDRGVSLAADIEEAREGARQFLQESGQRLPTNRMDESERLAAHEHARNRVEARVGGRPLRDFDIVSDTLPDGTVVDRSVAIFGRADGQGFASQGSARQAASNLGLDPEDVILDDSGRWFVRHTANVDESAFFTRTLLESSRDLMSRLFLGARLSAGADVTAGAVVGEMNRNAFVRTVVKPIERQLSRLNGAERRQLNEIAQRGMHDRQWYTREEFDTMYLSNTGSRPSNRVWNSYQNFRRMNDVEWELRNASIFRDKATRGFSSVSFDVAGVQADMLNARVFTNLPDSRQVYDPSLGRLRDLGEVPEGHLVVRLERPIQTGDGWTADTFLLRRNQVTERSLRYDQLAYSPGGHRMYPAEHFVRQTRRGTQPDGTSFLSSPSTFIGVRTAGQARWWADRMNAAREVVKAAEDGATPDVIRQLDELFESHPSLPSGREFVELVEEGKINIDEAFVALRDRELPREYQQTTTMNFADPDESAFEAWLGGQGRMYYGRKGEDALPDFAGREGQLLNMQEMLQRSLSNVANLSGFGDYRTEMVNRWARTYGQFTGMTDASPNEIFFQGRINSRDPAVVNSAEAQRRAIQNAMGQRTQMSVNTDAMMRQFIDRVAGDDPTSWFGKLRNSAATEIANWHRTTNAQAAITGAAFDLKLGLFNIAQLPLQMSHMYAIANLAPWDAGRTMINSGPSVAYMINGGEGVLDLMVQRGVHKLVGLSDPDDYRAMMRQMRESGFPFPGGSHIMINNTGTSALHPIREAGRWPFELAEGTPRAMAFQVGWMETRRKMPTADVNSPEFIRTALQRADDYAFNMTKATSAFWQQGITAVPTQFFSYFARMMEAMTSDKFTRAQRAQLLAGQAAGYGVAGVPFANLVMQGYEHVTGGPTGEVSGIDTVQGLAQRGLFDRAWYELTGQDVTISNRIGAGAFFGDFINNVFGNSPYGETSFAAIAGGASFNIWLQTFGDGAEFVSDLVQYAAGFHGDRDINIPIESFKRMASNISTANNALKAYMIHEFGIYQSSRGTVLIDGVPPQQWMATLLSFAPGEMLELSAMFDYMENEGEAVREITREITRLQTMMINDPDNATDYAAQIAAFMAVQDINHASEARRQARGEYNASLLEVMRRRHEQQQTRRMINDGTD